MKISAAILLTCVTFSVTSQIKVFPGGLQSYGSTTSPAAGVKHQFAGDLVVSEAGNTSSGCILLRANGSTNVSSASRPDFSWLGDNDAGIFHPASDVIAFTTGGIEKWRIASNGQLISKVSSAAGVPDYTWNGDLTTGMFHPASTTIGFTIGGTEKFRFHTNGQLLSSVTMNQSTPDFSFYGDPNTGMYNPSADALGFATGGTGKMRISVIGQLLMDNSTCAAIHPDYSWYWDDNTGIFHPSGDVFGITTGGTERARFSSSGNLLIGTTSVENARLNVLNGIDGGIYASCNYTADWQDPIIEAETNRSNSPTFRSTLTGTGTTFYVAGAGWIYSQGNYLGSDRNIKDDIHTIDSAGSKLSRITGVTYTLKKEKQNPALYGTANEYMGVIAQDVEAVAPQAVKTLNDGTKAVCYEMLVGLLIEGYKEQAAKVDKLQNDLNRCCEKTNGKTERSVSPSSTDNAGNGDRTYLKQNNPNPFNKETVIEYNIVESGNASILVFDMNGKLLKTIPVKIPGKGSITINANDFAAGMYYYSLIVNDAEIDTKKMILTQ